jgi:hypothetical protein
MAKTITANRQVVEDYQNAVREPPRLHNAIRSTASPGKRAAPLLPSKQERERHTHDADG